MDNEGVASADRGLYGWIDSYAARNRWRVARWMSTEDLMQDGRYWIAYCQSRYKPKTIEHLTSLVKRCFSNHITDLANKRSALNEVSAPEGEDQDEWLSRYDIDESDLQTLGVLVMQAPAEVKRVLELLTTEEGRAKLREPCRVKNGHGRLKQRETTNEKLCRIAGLPEGTDVDGILRQYLEVA